MPTILKLLFLTTILGLFFFASHNLISAVDEENPVRLALVNAGGSFFDIQQINLTITPQPITKQVSNDLVFAKIVVTYDKDKITLAEDPKIVTANWGYVVKAQGKNEVESKNPGKIILVAGITPNQEPISGLSLFAKLKFKKISANTSGSTVIRINNSQSQIVHTPAQEMTRIDSNTLSFSL
ncbi:hypothetical protein HY345_03000 [Candidatus Microgenomates bacterium]|nr:hypothetical protein [Candidatus Microgenomates bacterium]